MSRFFTVQNVASISKGQQIPASKPKVVKGDGAASTPSTPRRKSPSKATSPKEPVKSLARFNTQDEQNARIVELENDLQNLWHHYATSRKQKLSLMEENSNLQTDICRLQRSLSHETRLRALAEAKLDDEECETII